MIRQETLTGSTTFEVIKTLGRRFKDYRIASDLTQKEVSEKSGVSVVTIRKFENGQLFNMTLGVFFALLNAIDFTEGLDGVLPEIPVSPYELMKIEQGKRKRVRHGK